MLRRWITIALILVLVGAAAALLLVRWINVWKMGPVTKRSFSAIQIYPEDPGWGKSDAKVTVATFSSFTCSACREEAKTLRQIALRYPDKVRIIWKDLPGDDNAVYAAVAARCAQVQGKFWDYHDALYSNQDKIGQSSSLLSDLAQKLYLDMEKFNNCLQNRDTFDLVSQDVAQAAAANIITVPFSEVNGQTRVDGQMSVSEWKNIINSY